MRRLSSILIWLGIAARAATFAARQLQLELLRSVGGKGTELGEFNAPRHVAALPSGGVCVVDGLNRRVQILDSDLTPLRSIGDGDLVEPTGIEVDYLNNVLYVAQSTGAHHVLRLGRHVRPSAMIFL